MECLMRAAREAGAKVLNDCRAERLVQDENRRVVGLVARLDGREIIIEARRGVLLAAGGFVMNQEMLAKHAPALLQCNYPLGTPGDDGRGIRMGMGAGGEAINMGEGLVLNSYYPPSSHLKGVLVNAQGQRFINEDAYIGRTGDAILHKANGKAFLIVDEELYAPTQALHKLAAVAETFEELERELALPGGRLVDTLHYYNACAERGEDPLFHKAADYLRPLSAPPYAALDCSTSNSIFAVFTLGGLSARATGEVLAEDGSEISGLYAAGRNTAGLCREGRCYASGLSIGDASFFGRLAGRSAAAAAPLEPA
jgi:3-oxo-5alpha-steroid 4-dehydrogenase